MARRVSGLDQAVGHSRGTNQTGVRLYNERLVLSLIRRHEQVPKADLARLTNLSPQTVSIITNQLEADGLVLRGEPKRGKIGQPSVPYRLNPDGAYAFGLKIGRRSVDLYLINFVGQIVGLLHRTYRYPTPAVVERFTMEGIVELSGRLTEQQARRIAGLGIAAPYEMWSWAQEIGAPQSEIDLWGQVDMRERLEPQVPYPVYSSNDITAACAAELVFGSGKEHTDYLYVYIGSFVGGGLVLNGHLFPGRRSNAAALGSMPVSGLHTSGEPATQLMHVASIYTLESQLIAAGYDAETLWQSPGRWSSDFEPILSEWIDEAARYLAAAIVSAVAVVDAGSVLIDGAFPDAVRERFVHRTRAHIGQLNLRGLSQIEVLPGTIGHPARAIGGACLPLLANFAQDRELLFKDVP